RRNWLIISDLGAHLEWLCVTLTHPSVTILLEGVACGTEHVLNLVTDEIFDLGAGGSEVFTRIKFLRVFREDLADGGGHREPEVGVDIDFRATDAAGDIDIGFGDAG